MPAGLFPQNGISLDCSVYGKAVQLKSYDGSHSNLVTFFFFNFELVMMQLKNGEPRAWSGEANGIANMNS